MSNWIEFPILQELNRIIRDCKGEIQDIGKYSIKNDLYRFYEKLDGYLEGIKKGIKLSNEGRKK